MLRFVCAALFALSACPLGLPDGGADGGMCSIVRGVDRRPGDSCCTTGECAARLECVYVVNLQGGACTTTVGVGGSCSGGASDEQDGCGDGLACEDGACG